MQTTQTFLGGSSSYSYTFKSPFVRGVGGSHRRQASFLGPDPLSSPGVPALRDLEDVYTILG